MRVIVSGSTGLIGSAVCAELMNRGHRVVRLVRPQTLTSPNKAPLGTLVEWNPDEGRIDPAGVEAADVVIHLAGENLAGYWTNAKMHRIVSSRADGTTLLARTLTQLVNPPKLLLCASGVGCYGNRGDETLDEDSPTGGGFLAELCRRWEAAARIAAERGIRVAHLRYGAVLSPRGGALKAMLPAFKLGLGGKLGDGSQYMAWVSIDDAAAAAAELAARDDTQGPYNIVAPQALTNLEFTRALGRRLKRPTLLRYPETLLTLVTGDMAEHLLLASARVAPRRLRQIDYRFKHPTIDVALKELV